MRQSLPTDHPLVQATAELLSEDRSLTNAHLLRKLPGVVGASAVQEVPVTHFQRRVRQPAEKLLRERITHGVGGELKPPADSVGSSSGPAGNGAAPDAEADAPETDRTPPGGGTARHAAGNGRNGESPAGPGASASGRRGAQERAQDGASPAERAPASGRALSRQRRAAVDEALLSAFELAVEADSPQEVVEAYRRLQRLRDAMGARLS